MSYYTDDPASDASRYYADQEECTSAPPRCECCGQRITEDLLIDIYDSLYHVGCARRLFLKETEDYNRPCDPELMRIFGDE